MSSRLFAVDEQRIPPELVPVILGHLGGKETTQNLRVFSHVCRDWYFFTRPLLFQGICFTTHCSLGTLREASSQTISSPHSHGPLTKLLRFLTNSPVVSRYIRTLKLAAPSDPHQNPLSKDSGVDAALLVHILRRLPNLNVLELSDVLLRAEHSGAWHPHHILFLGSLKRLDITFPTRAASMTSYSNMLGLLELFAGTIDELCVSSVYALHRRVSDASSFPRLRVRGLVLDDVSDVAPLVLAVGRGPSISEGILRSVCLSWGDLRAASDLLSCVKDELEHFGCNMLPLLDRNNSTSGDPLRILDLSTFRALRSLTLGVVFQTELARDMKVLSDVCCIFSSLPRLTDASHLHVTLELRFNRPSLDAFRPLQPSWTALDETLVARCTSLRLQPASKRFAINTGIDGYLDAPRFAHDTRACLTELLPRLAGAGKLLL